MKQMRFIGITGGVGAGKSAVLGILKEREDDIGVQADVLAKQLMKARAGDPEEDARDGDALERILDRHSVHQKLVDAFAEERIFDGEGKLDVLRMSRLIFSDETRRRQANGIIHPAVKRAVLDYVAVIREEGRHAFFFLEAALLLEEHYDEICDEIWYIYASEPTRRKRLAESRGYSDEKIEAIFSSQLSEEVFSDKCNRVIQNDGSIEDTRRQIENIIKSY